MRDTMIHTQMKGHFHKELYGKVIIGPACRRIALTTLKNAISANGIPIYITYSQNNMKAILKIWPFQKWGLDIVGPSSITYG